MADQFDSKSAPAETAAALARIEEKLDLVLERLKWAPRHENGCVTGLEIAGNRPPGSLFTFHIVGTEGEITLAGDHAYGSQSSNLKLSSTVLREEPTPVPSEALQGPPANVAELYWAFGRVDDPRTFDEALKNITGIFLVTGYTVDMLVQSKSLIDAAKRNGVNQRFNSVF